MNKELSSKVLQQVMGWDLEETIRNIYITQFLANMKYDGYDQYMPGNRFLASLIQWLCCFDAEDRSEMFKFIKNDLVFISSTQMSYLVDLLYNSLIKKTFIDQTAKREGVPAYKIPNIENKESFLDVKRRALIMGLSDGAHTDVLRRSAGFSNEQVLTFYYPSEEKIKEMQEELAQYKNNNNDRFTTLYLIDDFTASGTSFIRYDKGKKQYKGKLTKILGQFEDHNENANNKSIKDLMIQDRTIEVYVCFCIATECAKNHIETQIQQYLKERNLGDRFIIKVLVVQLLNESLKITPEKHAKLYEIISKEKYFLKDIMKGSYKIGEHQRPYLGFNEGALPLVLSHNTPNNSVPILWQYSKDGFRGVFPRINRH